MSPRRWLGRLAPAGSFARGVTTLALGTGLGHGVIVLTAPLLTRLYTPEDFGLLAVYTSVVSVALVGASLRYEMAIPVAEDDVSGANALLLSLGIVFITTGFMVILVWLFGRPVAVWLNTPGLRPFLWMVPLSFLGAGVYQCLTYWGVRTKTFGYIAQARFAQSFGMVATQLGLGMVRLGAVGLLAGDVVGRASATGPLAWHFLKDLHPSLRRLRVRSLVAVAQRFRSFPLYTTWASLLNVISLQIPFLMLAKYFGPSTAGWYSLGYRVLGLPILLLGQAVGQVFLSRAAEAKSDPRELARVTKAVTLLQFSIGLCLFVPVAVGGRLLFPAVFGADWTETGVFVTLLAPWFLLWLVSSPLSNLLIVREWQALGLIFTIFEVVLRVSAIYAGVLLGSAVLAVGFLAGAGMIVSVAATYLYFRAANLRVRDVSGEILRLTGLAAVTVLPLAGATLIRNVPLALGSVLASVSAFGYVAFRQLESTRALLAKR